MSSTAKAVPAPRTNRGMQAGWLQGPSHDVAMAFIWLPFALAARIVSDDPELLRWLVSATLLFSFAHQPLTLWLVYGDADQRRAHARVFTWAPPALVLLVGLGSSLRPELVALIAGVWNVSHTIRQRYGISRLYGRRCGVDCADDNRLLWSWLLASVAIALATTDLSGAAADAGMGHRTTSAIEALEVVRLATAIAVPVSLAVAIGMTARSVRAELSHHEHSPARLTYLGSTALLLGLLAADPVSGFVAYVGAHAAEYLLVVRWRIGRATEGTPTDDRVGALARRIGSGGTMAVYGLAVIAMIVGVRAIDDSDIATWVVLTLGALHLLYDGFIWRSPRTRTPQHGLG